MNPFEITIKELIKQRVKTRANLDVIKRKIAKNYRIPCPSNVELLLSYHELVRKKRIKKDKNIERLLRTRPVRSLSGIVNVSVLTKPYPCPGKCIFCPTEKGFPKSYLAGEPAADRAKALGFDPYLQTKKRVEALRLQGHPTDKVELRIVGGTFSFYPRRYQTWFITRCFAACNAQAPRSKRRTLRKIKSLKEEQELNEKAKNRIVGISVETRPDFIKKEEILRLRKLGVTLVELGIQNVFDDVLKKCQTGLTTEKIAQATRLLKDSGFKILYQVMPNLPGSNLKKDLKCSEVLFKDERFKPDWLKIYPCLICKNTLLYQWWKKGKYHPYTDKELIKLLIEIKKLLPYWTRLTRLFRDIPAQKIVAGCKASNLRKVVQKEMKNKGLTCHCIRCREIRGRYHPKEKIYLFRQDYDASGGREIFLSFENKKRTKLLSFLRLRIPAYALWASKSKPSQKHFIPALHKAAIIREIQTFGLQVPISEKKLAPQHKGLGKKLIKEGEKIAKKEWGLNKMAVISGIGARDYFRKLGYKLKDTYLVKKI